MAVPHCAELAPAHLPAGLAWFGSPQGLFKEGVSPATPLQHPGLFSGLGLEMGHGHICSQSHRGAQRHQPGVLVVAELGGGGIVP